MDQQKIESKKKHTHYQIPSRFLILIHLINRNKSFFHSQKSKEKIGDFISHRWSSLDTAKFQSKAIHNYTDLSSPYWHRFVFIISIQCSQQTKKQLQNNLLIKLKTIPLVFLWFLFVFVIRQCCVVFLFNFFLFFWFSIQIEYHFPIWKINRNLAN